MQGHHVRLHKPPPEKAHRLAARTSKVDPITLSRLDVDMHTDQGERVIHASDEQSLTSSHLAGTLLLDTPRHT